MTSMDRNTLDTDVRTGFRRLFMGGRKQSAWGFLPEGVEDQFVKALSDDLDSGEWDKKFGEFRTKLYFTGALRLVIATP
jgi:hypothetical protein